MVENKFKLAGKIEKLTLKDFSIIEDSLDAFIQLKAIAGNAGIKAAAEAKAAGLATAYIRNNKFIVKVDVTGGEIKLAPKIKRTSYYFKYKPATILNAINR